jgi:hypothetical protein
VRFGPVSSGGMVFLADEKDLLALESGNQIRWSQPLAHGLPSRVPLKVDADWVVVFRDGTVSRLSADSGQELAAASIGQFAGSAAAVIGDQIVIAGADGTLHTVPLPK